MCPDRTDESDVSACEKERASVGVRSMTHLTEKAREAWLIEAQSGLAEEARHLEENGPTLARFRQV